MQLSCPRSQEPLVASLLLVVRPGDPSSFLFLVVMPGAPSSVSPMVLRSHAGELAHLEIPIPTSLQGVLSGSEQICAGAGAKNGKD